MDTKYIIIGILVFALAFVIFQKNEGIGGETFIRPALTANTSAMQTIVDNTSTQIVASTSRSYLRVTRDDTRATVYCNMNGDAEASATVASFSLSTTTGEVFEMWFGKNPYDGAVHCFVSATSSIIVHELKRN